MMLIILNGQWCAATVIISGVTVFTQKIECVLFVFLCFILTLPLN